MTNYSESPKSSPGCGSGCPCLEPRGFRRTWTVFSTGEEMELAESVDVEEPGVRVFWWEVRA